MADYTPNEINRAVSQYYDEISRLGVATNSTTAAFNDATRGVRGYTATLQQQQEILSQNLKRLGLNVLTGQQGVSQFAESVKSAGDVIDKWASNAGLLVQASAKLVKMFANITGAGIQQIDALNSTYQQITRFGAGVDSFGDTFKMLQQFNYSVDEAGAAKLASLFQENAQALQMFGGSMMKGTKNFAEFNRDIRDSGLYNSFKNLGLTSEDINRSMAGFVKASVTSGQKITAGSQATREALMKYVKEQEAVTKLTGATRQEQEAAREAARAETSWRAEMMMAEQEGDKDRLKGMKDIEDLTAKLPANIRQGILQMEAPDSPAAQQLRLMAPAAMEALQEAKRTGKGVPEALDQLGQELKGSALQFAPLAKIAPEAMDFAPGFAQMADATLQLKDFAKNFVEATKAVADRFAKDSDLLAGFQKLTTAQDNLRQTYEQATNLLGRAITTYIPTLVASLDKLTSQIRPVMAAASNLSEDKNSFIVSRQGQGTPAVTEKRNFGSLGTAGKLFENFGKGTLVELHNIESVQTPEQFKSIISNVMSATAAFFDPASDKVGQARMAGLPVDAMLKDLGASMKASLAGPNGFASLAKMGVMPSFTGSDFVEPVATSAAKKIPDAGFSADRPIQIDSPVIVNLLNQQIIKFDEMVTLMRRLNGSSERIAQLA